MPDHTISKDTRGAAQSFITSPSAQMATLTAGLYLVSTPIGNLRDITLRALDILSAADLVLAEDTRTSGKLMQAYDLQTPLSAYHDHNAAKRVPNLIERIKGGAVIALISDAGTPLVSDPGFKLARACIDEQLPVIAIPGASAVLAGLVSSGMASDKFMFAGFLPPKTAARKTQLETLASVPSSLIFFESAGRLSAALTDMLTILGDRPAAIARELTKKYEEILHGTLTKLIEMLSETKLRGEIVVIIAPPPKKQAWNEAEITKMLLIKIPEIGVKRASEEISKISGQSKRNIYTLALKLKNGTTIRENTGRKT